MTTKIRYINASIRTPATNAPYKSLNFAALDKDGKELKDAAGNIIRVTRGAPSPAGQDLRTVATTMRGVRVEDGLPGKETVVACLDATPVRVRSSQFAGGDMTYERNHEFSSITLDAEIEPIVDATGKAMVSEKRNGVSYAYYKLVRPVGPAEFHVSMFGTLPFNAPVALDTTVGVLPEE